MFNYMLRSKVLTRCILPARTIKPLILTSNVRFFANSPIVAAKKRGKVESKSKKGSKKNAEIEEEDIEEGQVTIDMKGVEANFKNIVEKFTKSANEAKLGKINPNLFDKLAVDTSDGPTQFSSLAQTTMKGRFLVITVFDPANSKHIVNAVLGSNLNMNPQFDPSDKQTLKVPLPPPTTESKKESVKNLKGVFEKFKTGAGKGNESLASIRSNVRNKFKKSGKKKQLSDAENKLLDDFEKLHTSYIQKLQEVLKAAEQAIMK